MGQVIRLEAAHAIGVGLARQPEKKLSKPRACDMKLMRARLLAETDEREHGRLYRGLEEFDARDRELRGQVLDSFAAERARLKKMLTAEFETRCVRCEENEGQIKLTATDLDGTVLDGPELVCRPCAAEAGFEVGR